MAAYMSSVFLLKPLVEQAIRAGPTSCGGVLNHHYLEHAQQQWKVWTCSVQDEAALRSSHGDLVCLYSKISRCRLLGVQPLKIIETVRPHMNIVRAAAVVEDGPIDESEGSAPAFSASALESPAASKLAGLHLPTSGGTVEHRFTVQGLLNCLRLAATSKPSASLADVLFAAAPLLLGDAAAQPVQAGLASALPLPSLDIMRCAGGNFAQTVKYTYEFAVYRISLYHTGLYSFRFGPLYQILKVTSNPGKSRQSPGRGFGFYVALCVTARIVSCLVVLSSSSINSIKTMHIASPPLLPTISVRATIPKGCPECVVTS